jgi:hypothetical protein
LNIHDDNDENKLAYQVMMIIIIASDEDDDGDDNEFGSTGLN